METSSTSCRHLVLVLGDQLNADSSAFDDFDRQQDAVWMAEVCGRVDARLDAQGPHCDLLGQYASLS